MPYKTTREKSLPTDATCTECGSKSVLYQRGTLTCQNCGHVLTSPKTRKNKFGAIKTVANDGLKRDSKFEASIADELLLRKQANDILDYDSQYKVEIPIYNKQGKVVDRVNHKVDFRIFHKDGSYELYEAKGIETADYLWRRRFLEKIWLDENPDHTYTVRYNGQIRHKKRRE